MKKLFYLPIAFHVACYAAMFIGSMFPSAVQFVPFLVMIDMAMAVFVPLYLAVVATIFSFAEEKRVIIQYRFASLIVGIIGVLRIAVFLLSGSSDPLRTLRTAAMYTVVSFAVLTLWFVIFEVTYNMMHRDTRFTRKKKK